MALAGQRPRTLRPLLVGGFLLALTGILALPVATHQGLNYVVTAHRIPLGLKLYQFLHRDGAYRGLAAQITRGLTEDEARLKALLSWVRSCVRPVPPGSPVVDDHILNIIQRGYGADDQISDLFSTLATYAGHPAFWKVLRHEEGVGKRVLSLVRVNGRWTVWDAVQGVGLRDAGGNLLSVEELTGPLKQQLTPFEIPEPLRAEKQMPIKRLKHELGRVWNVILAKLAHPRESEEPIEGRGSGGGFEMIRDSRFRGNDNHVWI